MLATHTRGEGNWLVNDLPERVPVVGLQPPGGALLGPGDADGVHIDPRRLIESGLAPVSDRDALPVPALDPTFRVTGAHQDMGVRSGHHHARSDLAQKLRFVRIWGVEADPRMDDSGRPLVAAVELLLLQWGEDGSTSADRRCHRRRPGSNQI